MEEDFYATVKLITGEELVAKVCPCEEEDKTLLILDNPVLVEDILYTKHGTKVFKVEPWIKLSNDSMFLIDMKNVITVHEITDKDIIKLYQKFINEIKMSGTSRVHPSNTQGYISNIPDFKHTLEKIFKSS